MKLSTRYIITMCILGLAIIAGLFLTIHFIIIPWHIDMVVQKARDVAFYIQRTSPLLTQEEMQRYFTVVQEEQKDFSYLVILDHDGKALVHSNPYRVGMIFNDEGTLSAARDGKKVEQIYIRDKDNPNSQYHGERIIDILMPYYDQKGVHRGAVNVGLSLKKVDEAKQKYYLIIFVNGLALLLVLAFITYKHFKHIIEPILSVAFMARSLGDGKAVQFNEIRRNDEIGMLAQDFQRMSQKIAAEMEHRKGVERKLKASNEELGTANEELIATNQELMAIEEELKAINEELFYSHSKISNILESINDGFCSLDTEFRVTYINGEAERLLLRTKEQLLGSVLWSVFPELVNTNMQRYLQMVFEEQVSVEFDIFYSVTERWFEVRAYPSSEGLSAYFHDITDRKEAEKELLIRNQHLSSLHETTLELMNRLETNDLLIAILNRARTVLGTKHCWVYMVEEDGAKITTKLGMGIFKDYIGVSLNPGEGLAGKVWQTGEPMVVEDYDNWIGQSPKYKDTGIKKGLAFPLKSGGQVVGVIGMAYLDESRQISELDFKLLSSFGQLASIALDNARLYSAAQQEIVERKKVEEIIKHQAHHDYLTNLPNRVLFNDRLASSLLHAKRYNKNMAVMFLDLDFFKLVNDTLGHDIGDQLLKGIAKRLSSVLRESDTIARIGGDEFTVLLPEMDHIDDAAKVAKKIINSLKEPWIFKEQEFFITTSIGIAIYPFDGEESNTLLKHADIAMYQAKGEGRNRYRFFAPEMNERNLKRLDLENSLRRGLEREEFVIHYQPQVDVRTGRIVGIEALLRWDHPQRGLVYPMEFINVAEETGLIIPIGEQVLKNACAQTKEWQNAGYSPMRVAVNLSARQFQQQNLVQRIQQILKETGLEPRFLELEITESLAMHDVEFTIRTLKELRQMGISIAIDDFGTGYSSLNYLKRLPIDYLKIDRSFIRDIAMDFNDAAIVDIIIMLAHNLKLKVIAEGVETEEQFNYLQNRNCDELQGYLFYKPMPTEDITRILELEGINYGDVRGN